MSINNKNRIGIMNITYELLENTDLLKEAFAELSIWVIDVEHNYQLRAKRYILESEHFDELIEGENIPEYKIHAEFNETLSSEFIFSIQKVN